MAVGGFLDLVLNLPSFPLFGVYLFMIALSAMWQRFVSPVQNLGPFLILHNFVCCIASVVSFCGFSYCIWQTKTLYSREPTDLLTSFFTLYWITKVLELFDTVLMILRHKSRQITFLHVYHHSSMLLLSDLAWRHYPWPAIGVFLAMNSFVHILLYLYYGLAAVNPADPPAWKKQMTQLQIAQFLIGFIVALYGYLHHNYCIYSILYGITMTWLFSHFYYDTYIKKRVTIKNDGRRDTEIRKSKRV